MQKIRGGGGGVNKMYYGIVKKANIGNERLFVCLTIESLLRC